VLAGRDRQALAARRWALIADDLTGAADAAAAFAQAGFSASVVLDEEHFEQCGADLLACSTETRNADPETACERTGSACERLAAASRLILVKKIDSVLRGSPLAETEEVRRRLGGVPALLTPALPAQGRIVSGGRLLVRDPATGRPQGPPAGIAAGPAVEVADASTFADLRQIASQALDRAETPLFVGSAGLAEALAVELASRLLPEHSPPVLQPVSRPALFLIGTGHPVTLVQVRALLASGKVEERTPEQFPTQAVSRSVLLRLSWNPPASLAGLAQCAGRFGALVLSGGDTARSVLDAFGAREIALGGELAPGIPWGRIRGGAADGIMVVTKSGGFGAGDALLAILQAVMAPQR